MSPRIYSIPSLSALSLSLTAVACSPGIQGDWVAVELGDDPMTYSYTYGGGCTISYGADLSMEITEKDGQSYSGDLTYGYHYDFQGCSAYGHEDGRTGESYTVHIEIDTEDRKVFEIDVDDMDLRLTCDLDQDLLDCEDEDGTDIVFERDD